MNKKEELNEIFSAYDDLRQEYRQEVLVELLHEIQALYGCIPEWIQERIEEEFGVGRQVTAKIVKIYPSFKEASYRHKITVCMGQQCSRKKSTDVLNAVSRELGIEREETTEDGRFFLTVKYCMKQCRTAPNMEIDGDRYAGVRPDQIKKILKKYK